MSNEHIGRLRKIGLGQESTSGTAVAATDWIPSDDGGIAPDFAVAKDDAAWGNIAEVVDSTTVRESTKTKIVGIFREKFGGRLLKALTGTDTVVRKFTMAGGSGTFVVAETVTQATSGATGTVSRIDGTTLYVAVVSGTFTSGSNLITGGTSSATGTPTYDTTAYWHLFTLLNSNTHPSVTLWEVSPVATYKAPYSMLDQFTLEVGIDTYLKFDAQFVGKKSQADTGTPAYSTSQYALLAKYISLYLASATSGLAAASVTSVSHFKITFKKNVTFYQEFGSVDIKSVHNQSFAVSGEIDAIFNATTLRDLVSGSTKQAMRLKAVNTDVTIGGSSNPSLIIDLDKCAFENWTESGGLNGLQMQKVAFTGQYSVSDAEMVALLLCNTVSTAF